MASLNIFAVDEAARPLADHLGRQLGLPSQNADAPWPELVLRVSHEQGLALWRPESRERPVQADFLSTHAEYRRRHGGGRGQALARAAGLRHGHTPTVIDATGGLGRDAFVLASLGCEVTLIERQPVIAALLEDGLERARAASGPAAEAARRMTLVHADAIHWLASKPVPVADVIYLDPMYPARGKSALPGREMQLLQQVAGADEDVTALLEAALAAAGRRVVLKRPRLAPQPSGPAPEASLTGKSTRYDIYPVIR